MSNIINLEAITIGIIGGIIINNTMKIPKIVVPGIKFTSKIFLELGIALLGFRISIHGIRTIGVSGLIVIGLYICCTLLLTYYLGTKIFKTGKGFTWLIGIGTAVCGSSAIAALAPAIGSEQEAPIAISYINVMAAIGLIFYTIVGYFFTIDNLQFGFWSGLTLHGVGHAIASAFAMGQEAGEIGTFVKMTRVATLAPLVLIISGIFSSGNNSRRLNGGLPLYLAFFFLAALANTLGFVPAEIVEVFNPISSRFILMAMIGLGLTVRFEDIKKEGFKVAGLVISSFVILSILGLLLTRIII